MIDDRQLRAARGLVNWTQEELADIAGVARATIKNIENGATLPRVDTMNAIQKAFEEAGVEFLPGSGVRMKDRMVQVFEGKEANHRLLDDVYNTLKDAGGEILISHVDETLVIDKMSKEFLENHLKRLKSANITERMLVRVGDSNLVAPWASYRAIPEEYFVTTPMFIYGDKLGLASWQQVHRAVIIHDKLFAESARRLFNFIWDRAQMPTLPQQGAGV